jgi:Domain of unknown function (DUF4440)
LFYVALIVVAPICFGQASPPTSDKFGQASPSKPDKFAKEAEITEVEKAAWEAFKNKQADAFKKLLSKRYCGVYAEGTKTADVEAADMAKFDLRDYSLGDMKVTFPSIGVAVVTYKATQQATFAGQDISGAYNCASVLIVRRENGLSFFTLR